MHHRTRAQRVDAARPLLAGARFAVLCWLLTSATTLAQTADFQGRVTDSITGKSVTGASVSLVPTAGGVTLTAHTGAFGFYAIADVPAGDHTLQVRHRAYQPHDQSVTATSGNTSTVNVELVPLFPAEVQVDLLIDVTDTRTGVHLPNIPIRVQRFSLADLNVQEDTITTATDAGGRVQLPGFRPGYYTFRFNNAADGVRVPFWRPLDITTKHRLERPHAVHAQLLPDSQQVRVRITGPDPVRPDDGVVPLAGISVDLTGVGPELDPNYVPGTEPLSDAVTTLLPTRTAVTDDNGEVTFKNLPPIDLLVEAKKPGYLRSEEIVKPATGTFLLPPDHIQTLALDPDTTTWLFFTSVYPDPGLMTGLEVRLEGLEGTNTEGIERMVTAIEVLPDPIHYPDGSMWAEFPGLLPGRYRASVDQTIATPDSYFVNEFSNSTLDITYQGGRCFDVAQGVTNFEVEQLRVVPATIRGRLLVADEARELEFGTTPGEYINAPRLLDAIYKPRAQTGIEITQSEAAQLLPPGMTVISVETDATGAFTISALPGAYGVNIPGMTDYWGANHELVDLKTGEAAVRGWPYSISPFQLPPPIPFPPFGSYGMPIESGGDYQLTLYVRKQLYHIRGSVPDSLDNPLANRVLSNVVDPPITVAFSEVVNGGQATMTPDGGGGATVKTLIPSNAQNFGIGSPAPGGAFEFPLGPGDYTLTYTHPWHTFRSQLTGATSLPIPIPDIGPPGTMNSPQIIPLSDVFIPIPGGNFDIIDTADYGGLDTVTIKFFRKDNESKTVLSHTLDKPHVVVSPNYLNQFHIDQFRPFRMIAGTWEIWVKDGDDWYHDTVASVGTGTDHTIMFHDVDDFNGTSSPPPEKTYDLHVRAVLDSDPTFVIPGLLIKFDNGDGNTVDVDSENGMHSAHRGDYSPLEVMPMMQWIPAVGSPTNINSYDVEIDTAGTSPDVFVTVRMRRGMGVSGTVRAANINGMQPLDGAKVTIRHRWGQTLRSVTTDENGAFQLATALALAQTIFVEVDAPGYFPARLRFTPGDGSGPGNQIDVVANIDLTPLPRPEIVSATFNRQGVFLPGVTKSSAAGTLSDAPAVTTTFSVTAKPVDLDITLPPFDTPAGAPVADATETVPDKLLQVWIFDQRWFADDPFLHDPAMPDVANNMPASFTAPSRDNPLYPVFMRKLLAMVTDPDSLVQPPEPGKAPRTFFRKTASLTETTVPGEFLATGSFSLADLPPGPFKPFVVVETARGSFEYTEIKSEGNEAFKNLYGIKLPPWAATIADTLGTAAAVQSDSSAVQFDKIFPAGFVEAIPEFTGDISADGSGFLTYGYGVGVKIGEGMDIPGGGLLAMAPGFNGLDVTGALNVTLKGNSTTTTGQGVAEFSVAGEVVANKTVIGIEEYIPKSLSKRARRVVAQTIRDNASFAIVAGGSARLETVQRSIGSKPLEIGIESKTTAGVGIPIEVDLTPVIKTVPTIGQIVATLDATVDLDLIADIDAAIGTTVKRSFTTRFPHHIGNESVVPGLGGFDPNPLSPRQHFLGGSGDAIDVKFGSEQAFCLRFGVGLTAQVGSGTLGARGHLALEGNECRLPTGPGGTLQPALKFTLNEFGDWPPVTRIEGALNGGITAFLDLYITRVQKSWEFELLKIDVQLNSDAVFTLTPFDVVELTFPLLGGTAVDWIGQPPTLIDRYYTPTGFGTAVGLAGGLALALTDIDPGTGAMILKVATRTAAGVWGSPAAVSSAPGVVAAAVHPLPAGGWIAVWSELDAAGAGTPFPTSALKFATSADATTWTAAATIATCGGVAADLRLLDMGSGDLGLVYLESVLGPLGSRFDVNASLFTGGAWGACQTLAADQEVRAWDAAGPGETGTAAAEIAGLDGDGRLAVTTWDGTAAGVPVVLLTNSGNTNIDLASGPADTYYIAAGDSAAGIELFAKTAPGAWASLGKPLPAAMPQSVALAPTDDGTDQRLALAWTSGAATSALRFAYLDTAGNVLLAPQIAAPGGSGIYRNLVATPVAGAHEADLFAVFEGPGSDQLRTFQIGAAAGLTNPDRDGDTLPDAEELRIVDADPDDAIESIDDVLAGDDFDGEGATNGTEIGAGTDPIDPHSFPGQLVQVFSDTPTCFEFGTLPATFNFTRGGDVSQGVTVHYSVAGTATPGTDYPTLSGEITFPAGISHQPILLAPFGDTEAEGDETIALTLTSDPAYTIGTADAATVTIADLPMDGWRFANFTAAELANPAVSGDAIDLEGDTFVHLLEYAFARNPKSPDAAAGLPVSATIENGGQTFAALVFVRPRDADDLLYHFQAAAELGSEEDWQTLTPTEYEIVSITDNGDGTETVVVRDQMPIAANSRRFLRLQVERLADF